MTYGQTALCTIGSTSANHTSSWTMIESSNGSGFAQSGMVLRPGICPTHFAEQVRGVGYPPHIVYGVCVGYGETHHAWQQTVYNGPTAPQVYSIRSNIDLTIFIDSKNDGWNNIKEWSRPYYPIWSGETHFGESDIPGTASAPTLWQTVVQVQDFNDNSWHDTCQWVGTLSGLTPLYARYAISELACNAFEAWTK